MVWVVFLDKYGFLGMRLVVENLYMVVLFWDMFVVIIWLMVVCEGS